MHTSQMVAAAAVAAVATLPGGAAFTTSVPSQRMQMMTNSGAFCKSAKPLNYVKNARRQEAVAGLKMELIGKRYWMWNVSEWAFDKFIALTQVVVFTLYGVFARLFESPYDEARLKAIRRRIAELRASREAQEPRNALDMMDVVWEVGAADEKLSSKVTSNAADPLAASSTSGTQTSEDIEAPSLDSRSALSLSLIAIPAVAQSVALFNDDVYLQAVAHASVWVVFLMVFVDWAAGSPAGVATAVKRALPISVRKYLNTVSPRVNLAGQRASIRNEAWRSENYMKDI